MIMFKIIAISLVLSFLVGLIAKHFERKAFNNGICRNCGEKLRYFDSDSQGGRLYCCDKCNSLISCSYNVDKNFK